MIIFIPFSCSKDITIVICLKVTNPKEYVLFLTVDFLLLNLLLEVHYILELPPNHSPCALDLLSELGQWICQNPANLSRILELVVIKQKTLTCIKVTTQLFPLNSSTQRFHLHTMNPAKPSLKPSDKISISDNPIASRSTFYNNHLVKLRKIMNGEN